MDDPAPGSEVPPIGLHSKNEPAPNGGKRPLIKLLRPLANPSDFYTTLFLLFFLKKKLDMEFAFS